MSRLLSGLALTAALSSLPVNAQDGDLAEADRVRVEDMRRHPATLDRRRNEADWAAAVERTVKNRLIQLYQAELQGRVKVSIAAFVPPDDVGADLGRGPSLHIVKLHEARQPDGRLLRTYVNEHWPLSERTGGLLPPDAIRVRLQAFSDSGRGDPFITDLIQVVWGVNADGSAGAAAMHPVLYRQHRYGAHDKELGLNAENQLFTRLSSPQSCVRCHVVVEGRPVRGAITPDEAFSDHKPLATRPAAVAYLKHLAARGAAAETVAAAREDLANPAALRVPGILEALKSPASWPWLDGDQRVDWWEAHGAGVYRSGDAFYRKAGVHAYRYAELLGIGDWWHPDDLQLLPRRR